MTSDRAGRQPLDEAYVWIWLPGATEPVVAGRLAREGSRLTFNYGRSYLERADRIPVYEPELPLRSGAIPPEPGLEMAGCLRDAAPDAWGRRVILNRSFGRQGTSVDTAELDELTYLLESGSDRAGALDFQHSAREYVPRSAQAASIEELLSAAERVEQGVPLTAELAAALLHGTSIGGARPKATIEDGDRKLIGKFASSTDSYNVVKAEYVAMRLAAIAGLEVAPVRLAHAAGKDVLLVERFDREAKDGGWTRRAMVSALTVLGLNEMMARYASYADLGEIIRHRFDAPRATLHELYGRVVFNILCGNPDDHARNHACFWDGQRLALTPAFDICPQHRAGNMAGQAMLIAGDKRQSNLAVCIEAAPHFHLDQQAAEAVVERQIDAIHTHWDGVCEEAELGEVDRKLLGGRMFLNRSIFENAPQGLTKLPPSCRKGD